MSGIRIIFILRLKEVRTTLYNKELSNLHISPDIIRVLKPGTLRWAGHLTRTEDDRNESEMLALKLEEEIRIRRPRHIWESNVKRTSRKYDVRLRPDYGMFRLVFTVLCHIRSISVISNSYTLLFMIINRPHPTRYMGLNPAVEKRL
jgi:hypothetical protein